MGSITQDVHQENVVSQKMQNFFATDSHRFTPAPINLCYSLYDASGTYAKFIAASLCSVLEHTRSNMHIYLLHDETMRIENRRRFCELTAAYGQTISFCPVTLPTEIMTKMRDHPYSPATLYRLYIAEVLPPDVEYCLYLDADTIVTLDLAALWSEPMNGADIAATADAIIQSGQGVPPLVQQGLVVSEKYFNAGILKLNLAALRHQPNLVADGLDFLCRSARLCKYADQDVLNYFFRDRCRLLPPQYNVIVMMERYFHRPPAAAAIYHYTANCLGFSSSDPFDRLFWHYFCRTPWCNEEFLFDMVSAVTVACDGKHIARQEITSRPCRLFLGPAGEAERRVRQALPFNAQDVYYYSGEGSDSQIKIAPELLAKLRALPSRQRLAVLITDHYTELAEFFRSQGFQEGCDFINGLEFLRTSDWDDCLRNFVKRL